MAQPRPPFVNFFYSITKYTVKHNSFSRIRTQIVKVEGEREHSYNRHYISSKVFCFTNCNWTVMSCHSILLIFGYLKFFSMPTYLGRQNKAYTMIELTNIIQVKTGNLLFFNLGSDSDGIFSGSIRPQGPWLLNFFYVTLLTQLLLDNFSIYDPKLNQ